MTLGVLPAVRFSRERIEVTVRPSGVEVNGLYFYENPLPFPMTQGLNYPFPTDAAHPAPGEVVISEVWVNCTHTDSRGSVWTSY